MLPWGPGVGVGVVGGVGVGVVSAWHPIACSLPVVLGRTCHLGEGRGVHGVFLGLGDLLVSVHVILFLWAVSRSVVVRNGW